MLDMLKSLWQTFLTPYRSVHVIQGMLLLSWLYNVFKFQNGLSWCAIFVPPLRTFTFS
jgi:hypothetical protein